jgi:predicted transcriptional regulator YdeE/uncharacterized protein YndB with AHSA1/START domain
MPRFHVHRSIQINAPAEQVFDAVADFNSWAIWSPWLCAEPDAEVKVTGDGKSVGAVYSWRGELVGEGEIEHLHLQPGRMIEEEIRFKKPFRSKSKVSFEIEPVAEGTQITWHMRGSLPWFMFWMCSQMEVFIGLDYERGLKMLKEWLETGKVLSETKIHGLEAVGPLRMIGVRKVCAMSDIGPSMEAAFAEATEKLAASNLRGKNEGISVYHQCDTKAETFDYTAGFVFPESAGTTPSGLSSWSIPSVQALRVEHIGSYENVGNGWGAAYQYARYKKLKEAKTGTFELYKNDPNETPPAELRTEIFLPVK